LCAEVPSPLSLYALTAIPVGVYVADRIFTNHAIIFELGDAVDRFWKVHFSIPENLPIF
jgi:hypothetical protein